MKRKKTVFGIIAALAIVGLTIFGSDMYKDRENFRIYLENQYQRNLYDVITNVDGVEVSLSKALITTSQRQSSILFGDIWRQSSSAQDKINALPIAHGAITDTSKFLSQLSDFSYTMLKSNTSVKSLPQSELSNLQKLKDYCGYITLELREFESQVGRDGVKWNEFRNIGSAFLKKNETNLNSRFQKMSDQIQQYPTLIYDGPFSENVLNIKPRVLDEKEITIDEAKKVVEKVINTKNIEAITQYSNKSGEKIPAYALSVKLKGRSDSSIDIDISKNGGHVVYMLDTRSIENINMDIKQSVDIGLKFLKTIGYPNMLPTYTLRYDGVAVINYVELNSLARNKVLIYPDQIKLKVALDNGDIVGVESQHYLAAHQKRNLQNPKISVLEAKKIVSKGLNIKNIRLALIPMESLKEILCYEFYGEYNGERFFVYINTQTGAEERILKIIDTKNGELTM